MITVAVDEPICMCQSKCNYVVLMKNKPISKGLKFSLCNDSYTGYCLNFILHNLKKGTNSPTGFTAEIVERTIYCLVNLPNTPITAVVDNFCGSVDLGSRLLVKNTHLLGTLRTNRIPTYKEQIGVSGYRHGNLNNVLHLPYKQSEYNLVVYFN